MKLFCQINLDVINESFMHNVPKGKFQHALYAYKTTEEYHKCLQLCCTYLCIVSMIYHEIFIYVGS